MWLTYGLCVQYVVSLASNIQYEDQNKQWLMA